MFKITSAGLLFMAIGSVINGQDVAVQKTRKPMSGTIEVRKEIYVRHTRPGSGKWVSAYYNGQGLERVEVHSEMAKSDTPVVPQIRRSPDNGRTWSDFQKLPKIVTYEQGARIFWGSGPQFYDPKSKVHVSIWLRQTKKKLYFNHSFFRISRDNGKNWSKPKQLRYEAGAEFDPENPLNPEFLNNNQSYLGNNIIQHSGGKLIHIGTSINVPYKNTTGKSYDSRVPANARNIGSVCFLGEWNEHTKDYNWKAGKPVWVPLEVSSRGLMEPDVTELTNGRILVVWRGSNTPVTPGRKWFSLSDDGGLTLSPVAEWKYDDGSKFYSPSSIHRFIRHSVTGKLYWVGNICLTPPRGNGPRYPLVIAEVDESIPALRRKTQTVIDDKGAAESPKLHLSNFSLLENRETHDVEIYLTRIGANPKDFWGADTYKYSLTFK